MIMMITAVILITIIPEINDINNHCREKYKNVINRFDPII